MSATALKDEGNAKFKAGSYAEAVEAYTKSLEIDSKQHLCYSNRSAAYLKLGDSAAKALADAEKCVQLMPDFVKGYSRQAAALQELERWDDAIAVCERGMSACSSADAESLKKTLAEVRNRHFASQLQGCWHGKVTEALGGYDQEMEFMDGWQVRVQVLGRSIIGHYKVDGTVDPKELDIQVSMQELPPGMPPPPPVPYIAKLDGKGLHLCCPYMKMERPTTFQGEGYCLMTKGHMESSTDSSIAGLSQEERVVLCAQELIAALPSKRLDMEEVGAGDHEEVAREKVMAQVKFETSVFKVQQKFGEEMMREVLESTKQRHDSSRVPKGLAGSPELAELSAKLRSLNISLDEGPPPPPAQADGQSKAPASTGKSTSKPTEGRRQASTPAESQVGGLPTALVVSLTIAGAAAVAGAVWFWRQRRR